jgi:hypothetical protein
MKTHLPPVRFFAIIVVIAATAATTVTAAPLAPKFPVPPQDQGLPYTVSGSTRALDAIRPCVAAVFPGSRYGYIGGLKIRLDAHDLLGGEALLQDGVVYVPRSFASLLTLNSGALAQLAATAPDYLRARWVCEPARPVSAIDSAIAKARAITVPKNADASIANETQWVALADIAGSLGLQTRQYPDGLLLVARSQNDFPQLPAQTTQTASHPTDVRHSTGTLRDCIVTLFDTPDKFADPDIATRSIPRLKEQGKWTEHVKVTPAQLALLDGPETVFPSVPVSDYNYDGLDKRLLGSPMPAPGVYPRLLFSEADIPMFRERMKTQKLGRRTLIEWEVLFQKTWWNPATSDGQVFQKLCDDDACKTLRWPTADIPPGAGMTRSVLPGAEVTTRSHFEGQKPGIRNTHINYNTNCLVTMALCCLLNGDDTRGRQVATALANYFRLLEPSLDAHLATSDSQWGRDTGTANNASTAWRGLHALVTHMDLAFALDLAGKWMTPAQKNHMRRFIAKATYGRRDNMQAAPARQRDINHMTWHLTHYLAVAAIEGLEGCDPEELRAGAESARAFLDWGIDKYGQMYESNGKNGGGLHFQLLSMIVTARRGGINLWGHPHFRKVLAAQVQNTSPDGKAHVSSGTWGASPLSPYVVATMKAFYPGDPCADYLLAQNFPGFDPASFNPGAYRAQIEKSPGRTRLPGLAYLDLVTTGLYDTDWRPVTRAELKLPLIFNDDVHGIFSAYGDTTPDAAWFLLHVRSNQATGSGHHHADVGMFYFSALGVNWITESPFPKNYDGKYHNEILIDGIAQPDGYPARGEYLNPVVTPRSAFASADQTRSYTYRWTNQIILWEALPNNDLWDRAAASPDRELETDDPLALAIYKGTQRYKSRPWWPTYVFSNWMPIVRMPHNPVLHAYRTGGLVRAGEKSFGIVADDIKKDDATRLYQWTAMLGAGVWKTTPPGAQPAPGSVFLARRADLDANGAPRAGAPLLLVAAIDATGQPLDAKVETARDGDIDPKKGPQPYDRIAIGLRGAQAAYRVLLIPFRAGGALPSVAWENGDTAEVTRAGETTRVRFTTKPGAPTAVEVCPR